MSPSASHLLNYVITITNLKFPRIRQIAHYYIHNKSKQNAAQRIRLLWDVRIAR